MSEQLRQAVAEVVTRLPHGARLVLDEMQISWRVNEHPRGRAHFGIEQLPTGRIHYVMELKPEVFNLPAAIRRRLIAHELAHAFLRHPDQQAAWDRAGKSAEEYAAWKLFQEDAADFLACVIWGFGPDYAESATVAPAPDGSLYRYDLPPWFDSLADRLKGLN